MLNINWDAILHVILVVCKIAGVVGAFLGLSERLHTLEKPSGWRRFAPAAFLLLAVSAEVIDAELKHDEDAKQAIRNEQLLRPIHAVTARLELTIPSSELREKAPAYYKRVVSRMNSDLAHELGYFEFVKEADAYPTKDDRGVSQALEAYYSSSLRFYPKMTGLPAIRPSKEKNDVRSADVWIELSPGTSYIYDWGQTDAINTPQYPPEGRRYMLNKDGLAFMDTPVTVDLNSVASSRRLRSISDFKDGELALTVCPEFESDSDGAMASDDLDGDKASDVSSMVYLRNLSLNFDGVGTFGGRVPASQFIRTNQGECVLFSFHFPSDSEALAKLFR